MTHLLPGGGVLQAHRARSPVPPHLLHFATPRSVRHFPTVVAGAYPLRRPPDAWWAGVPVPPGLCYSLVASGTPMGWRGGCLAVGLVRGTVCHYCLGGCSALVVCAGRSREIWDLGAAAGSRVSPVPPPPSPAFPAVCVVGLPIRGSLNLPRRYALPYGLCVPRAWSGRPSGPPRMPFAGVSARASAASAPSTPPQVRVARAPRVVPMQGAGRAVPWCLCPSAFPAPFP